MKKINALPIIGAAAVLALMIGANISASDNAWGEPTRIEVTAYCLKGTTATGEKTRKGICAGAKEYLGKTAILYHETDEGKWELYGIYEIEDTGSDPKIRAGKVIDIWMPTYEECIQFGRQEMYVQIVDAEG